MGFNPDQWSVFTHERSSEWTSHAVIDHDCHESDCRVWPHHQKVMWPQRERIDWIKKSLKISNRDPG